MDTKVKEALNRGNNLLVVGILSFAALGVFSEIFREDEWLDKADDIFVVLVALTVIVWYFSQKNRYQRSWVLFGLLAATAVVKVLAFINEFDDPVASGDEFGIVIPLVAITIVTLIIMLRTGQVRTIPEVEQVSGLKKSEN